MVFVLLTEDYTARDGATVTLLSAANLQDDVLEFQIFDDFRVADAIVSANADHKQFNGNLTVTGSITGVTSVTGAAIGIQSGGTVVGAAKTLNFIGTGNIFAMNGETVDIEHCWWWRRWWFGTAINYSNNKPSPFSYIDRTHSN